MKKILSLLSLLMLCVVGVNADSVDDLVAVGPGYTFIADNITANGTTSLTQNTLYDESRIFANTGNSVASNKGKITIGGEEHLNSLRIKKTQDQLVFKVSEPCIVKFYTQSHSSRGLQVGSAAGGTQYGKEPVHTTEWECAITAAGLVYLSSFEGDFFFAGFEVKAASKSITFTKPDSWNSVYVWAWNSDGNLFDQWPGLELTANSDGKYVWETTATPEHIIFSDNGNNETSTFDFKDGGEYTVDGRVVVLNNYTVNFKSDGGWNTVYAYTWTGNDGVWPGKPMEKTSDGEWTITIQAEEAPANILFHNNAGEQTPDLTFVDGKTYEYMMNEYIVTFTTDAGWASVNAYAWNGDGDTAKPILGDWPGTAISDDLANPGVFNLSFKAFSAPEKILFNNGTDAYKTPDMAFTNGRAYTWNTTLQPLFALEASQNKIPAGTTVDVKDGDDVVATLTYGVSGGADFAAPVLRQNEEYIAFSNYTAGNGENGSATNGTVYTIKPVYDGTITVGVWLNGDKAFYIQEDGTSLAGFDGYKQAYGSGTAFTFDVKAGSEYKVYCTGSKLGFYGFDFVKTYTATFTTDAGWENVYAYAWTGDGDGATKFLGDWPGTKLEKNTETGLYDVTIKSLDTPAKIIFNDGTQDGAVEVLNKTPDLSFVNGQAYPYLVLDVAKATLQDAIDNATTLNEKLGDADLAAAITTATNAKNSEEATVKTLAAAGEALNIAATKAAKDALTYAVALAKSLNVDVTDAEAALETGTAQPMVIALQSLVEAAKNPAKAAVATFASLLQKFNAQAFATLTPKIAAVNNAIDNGTFGELKTAIEALVEVAKPFAPEFITKVVGYAQAINNETLNNDIAAIQAAGEDFFALLVAVQKLQKDFITVASDYLETVKAIPTEGKQGVDELNNAINALESALGTLSPNIVDVSTAVRNLVKAVEAFEEANTFYTVAGTKNLTGTENDWDIVEANNMTLDGETGLYTWTATNITVNSENQPMFKVVITDINGNQAWIPASDAEGDHNWVITPGYVGGEGVFNITITFNKENNEIGVLSSVVLNLNEEGDNADVLEQWNGKIADVTLIRTLQTGSWNTFAVPFDLDTPTGWTVKELESSSVAGTTVTLNFKDATSIEAGKPYLVKLNANEVVENPTFTGVTVSNVVVPTVTDLVNFIPTFGATAFTGNDKDAILFLAAGNKLQNPTDLSAGIKGFRAYFLLKNVNSAREFVLDFGDGETTGITDVRGKMEDVRGGYYDLQGRRINSAAQKGVYIVNGKKTVIK